ncbi:MAG: DUF4007 family protein [Chloroflexi bacterium]|nr:DUF4007 family protein [Chloroflexota bacterium]
MKLQLTNGYRPRFDQISRILQFLLSQEERKKNSRQEIVAVLGIPENQVENLISMMTGFGLVFPRVTTLTPFGKAVIKSDPYFDKLETLWIIHYIVSSNPEWVVWHRIINTVLPTQDRYTVEQISNRYFSDLTIHFSERTISEKLPKEVGSVFAAYTRSELSHLGILGVEGTGNFIKTNPVEIPDIAFLFCLLYYRDKYSPGSSAVNIEDVCLAENSPGRVINLPEYQVRTILGNLHNAGLVRLEKLANLDQIRLSDAMTQENVLQRIYGGKDAN